MLFTQAFKTRPGVTAAVVSPQPRSSLDELKILITIHSMDVLTVSETWLDINVLDSEIDLPGYNLLTKDRKNRSGGGIATFIKNTFAYNHEMIWNLQI